VEPFGGGDVGQGAKTIAVRRGMIRQRCSDLCDWEIPKRALQRADWQIESRNSLRSKGWSKGPPRAVAMPSALHFVRFLRAGRGHRFSGTESRITAFGSRGAVWLAPVGAPLRWARLPYGLCGAAPFFCRCALTRAIYGEATPDAIARSRFSRRNPCAILGICQQSPCMKPPLPSS
jgi:hypothetical protein